jgi:hypothetical protein
MTTVLEPAEVVPKSPEKAAAPGLIGLWLSSLFFCVFPPASRGWLSAAVWRAAVVAGANTVLGIAWLGASIVCASLWVPTRVVALIEIGHGRPTLHATREHWAGFFETAGALTRDAADAWQRAATIDITALICGVIGIASAA